MKRLILLSAALCASFGFTTTAARADDSSVAAQSETEAVDPTLLTFTASVTNDLLNSIPGLEGPDSRHICMVFGKLNKSYCIYIPLP